MHSKKREEDFGFCVHDIFGLVTESQNSNLFEKFLGVQRKPDLVNPDQRPQRIAEKILGRLHASDAIDAVSACREGSAMAFCAAARMTSGRGCPSAKA